jgi:hypothetical protein
MANPAAPFYLDWPFWSAITAVLTFVLTQLPPLRLLFRRARLSVELYSTFVVNVDVGKPISQLHIIITNEGGRSIRVKSITLEVKRTDSDEFSLPGSGFFQSVGDKSPLLLTPFRIAPGGEWGHIVHFVTRPTREDDKRVRELIAGVKRDIGAKRQRPENKDQFVEADPKLVEELVRIARTRFKWQVGEYRATISIEADPARAHIRKSFRFTIFESDSLQLSQQVDDFKYGANLYWWRDEVAAVFVPVSAEA